MLNSRAATSGAIGRLQWGPMSALEESAGLLAAIIASSHDAIISQNLDGYVTSWNGAAERLFGFTSADIVGQHVARIIPPDRLSEEQYVMTRVRDGEAVDHL